MLYRTTHEHIQRNIDIDITMILVSGKIHSKTERAIKSMVSWCSWSAFANKSIQWTSLLVPSPLSLYIIVVIRTLELFSWWLWMLPFRYLLRSPWSLSYCYFLITSLQARYLLTVALTIITTIMVVMTNIIIIIGYTQRHFLLLPLLLLWHVYIYRHILTLYIYTV